MIPKEMARDLFDRVSEYGDDGGMYIETARQCALFTVDEILKSFNNVFDDFVISPSELGGYRNMKEYYKEVRQEIVNLKYE